MSDPAIDILAQAMYDVVERDANRKVLIRDAMENGANEYSLQPCFESFSLMEKFACSRRAKNLAYESVAAANGVDPSNDPLPAETERAWQ